MQPIDSGKLSEIERKALKTLETEETLSTQQIAQRSGLNIDSVRRAMSWLHDKKLCLMLEKPEEKIQLTEAGKKALAEGIPEKQLLMLLEQEGGKADLNTLMQDLNLGKEFNYALGIVKQKNWITVVKGDSGIIVELTGLEQDTLRKGFEEEKILKKASEGISPSKEESEKFAELQKRGFVEKKLFVERSAKISAEGLKAVKGISLNRTAELNMLDSGMLKAGSWRGKAFRKYSIQDPVPEIFAGKKQPYLAFLQAVKRKHVELGFKEVPGPLITQEFYNFDALFQPQDHPARSIHDTYQLKQPKLGKLPPEFVKGVKAAHEHGGKTGSKGWKYDWSEEIARKLMPTSHGTAHLAREFTKGIEVPGKYFSISRVYRPDVIDAKHLVEFNQMDGMALDESFTFRHLLGILKDLALEFGGCEKVKFLPCYFPFTEPSVQVSAKHPDFGWFELAGAGMFRPELMEALGYPDTPALAWGFGVDRLAMMKLGVKDIRTLFSDDLKYLRESKIQGGF